jgi:hypothetical protein
MSTKGGLKHYKQRRDENIELQVNVGRTGINSAHFHIMRVLGADGHATKMKN